MPCPHSLSSLDRVGWASTRPSNGQRSVPVTSPSGGRTRCSARESAPEGPSDPRKAATAVRTAAGGPGPGVRELGAPSGRRVGRWASPSAEFEYSWGNSHNSNLIHDLPGDGRGALPTAAWAAGRLGGGPCASWAPRAPVHRRRGRGRGHPVTSWSRPDPAPPTRFPSTLAAPRPRRGAGRGRSGPGAHPGHRGQGGEASGGVPVPSPGPRLTLGRRGDPPSQAPGLGLSSTPGPPNAARHRSRGLPAAQGGPPPLPAPPPRLGRVRIPSRARPPAGSRPPRAFPP